MMKRNEQSSHVKTWMNLKCLLLSGGRPVKRLQIDDILEKENYSDRKQISGCKGFGEWED